MMGLSENTFPKEKTAQCKDVSLKKKKKSMKGRDIMEAFVVTSQI
jgi:hypothetical protein